MQHSRTGRLYWTQWSCSATGRVVVSFRQTSSIPACRLATLVSSPPKITRAMPSEDAGLSSDEEAKSVSISPPNYNTDITTQRYGRTWMVELSDWKMELGCWAAGLACLGGIVGMLFPYHDKPLPQLPWNVKLNTIASVLATFANALLLAPVSSALGQLKWNWYCVSRPVAHFDKLDQASRGAWGSFKMLFSRPAL